MIKTTNIINLFKKNNFLISDTELNFNKYYSIEGQLIFTTGHNENKKSCKLIKFLQGYYSVILENFTTCEGKRSNRNLKELFNNLTKDIKYDYTIVFNTNIIIPYAGENYNILKDKKNNLYMVKSKYLDCFNNVYYRAAKKEESNMIYINDENNSEVTAIVIAYRFLNIEGKKMSIKEYVNSLI